MTPTEYRIEDTNTGETFTGDTEEINDKLREWHAAAIASPALACDTLSAIDDLAAALERGEHAGDHAAYLGLTVEPA